MAQIKRKLYKRGSSFETTIPMPLLFALDLDRRYNVVFNYEKKTSRWYIEFEPQANVKRKKGQDTYKTDPKD